MKRNFTDNLISILMCIALVLAGIGIGIAIGKYKILNSINLRALNEDYENEVILEIEGSLYENDQNGKFNKYYTLKKGG